MNMLRQCFPTPFRYRWVVWSLLVVCYMVSFFHRMSVAVVKEDITTQFGLSTTEFGAMASMYFYAYCIAQIPTGIMVDSVGVRRTVTISMAVAALATMAFGYAQSASMLYISRFMVGIGVAACFVCVMKVQSQWFKEREFSTLSGICLFVGNIGSLSAQAPLAFLVAFCSFGGAFFFIGLGTLLLALLCALLVRNTPQDVGFAPINPLPPENGESLSLAQSVLTVVKNSRLFVLNIFYFFTGSQLLGFAGTWSNSYIRDVYAVDISVSSHMASMQIVSFMLGSFLLGYLSDKTGKRKPFIVVPMLLVALTWAFLAVAGGPELPQAVYVGCLVVMGFFSGAFSVMMAICKELSPRQSTGTAIAVLNTFGFLGVALSTPVYGYVLDCFAVSSPAVQHHYATIFMACITVAGALCSLLLAETHGKNVTPQGEPEVTASQ